MNVTNNPFDSDFFDLNEGFSCFEIAAEFSFQNREFIFHKVSSRINRIIEPLSHFLTIRAPYNLVIPGGVPTTYRIQ
jgi:hypothetical protein